MPQNGVLRRKGYRARAEIIMQDNAERFYFGEFQPRGHLWER